MKLAKKKRNQFPVKTEHETGDSFLKLHDNGDSFLKLHMKLAAKKKSL